MIFVYIRKYFHLRRYYKFTVLNRGFLYCKKKCLTLAISGKIAGFPPLDWTAVLKMGMTGAMEIIVQMKHRSP